MSFGGKYEKGKDKKKDKNMIEKVGKTRDKRKIEVKLVKYLHKG
jgi:hypothetical protein